MEALKLQRNISYGSILPIVVFISGLLVIYFFSSQLFAEGMITMLFSSIFYIVMVVIRSSDVNPPTQFNLILENISTFMTFGISSIMFGVMFYSPNVDILFILFIYFFAIACVLSVARNWEYDVREALGMPLAFNGIFFPLFYYMFRFYFNDLGDSIFLLYYVITGILTLSSFKFLWFDEKYIKDKEKYSNYYSKVIEEDELIQQRIKQRKQKSFDENSNQNSLDNKIEKYDIKKIRKDILEDSIFDKIKKSVCKLFSKKDEFNTISGMPSVKELEETLPHTAQDSQPKKKERGFRKLVRKIFFKSGKSYDDYSKIKGMLYEKKLEETLSKSYEVKIKKSMINNLSSSSNNQKKNEFFLIKIIKFITSKFKSMQVDNFSVISGMPDEKELKETLVREDKVEEKQKIFDKKSIEPKKKKIQTKLVSDDFDLVGGNNTIKSIKPEIQNVQFSTPKYEKIENPISQKEIEEVFVETKPSPDINKANLNNPNNLNYSGNKNKEQKADDYDEDYDYEQEIDFEEIPKKKKVLTQEVGTVDNAEYNSVTSEEFDLGEFDNDYVEKK
jgi:hypothetical protein